MESTMVRADPLTIVPNSSKGYAVDASGIKEASDLDASYGAGGIYTTPEDFNQWFNKTRYDHRSCFFLAESAAHQIEKLFFSHF